MLGEDKTNISGVATFTPQLSDKYVAEGVDTGAKKIHS